MLFNKKIYYSYVLAFVSVFIATLIRFSLEKYLGHLLSPFIFFYPAVIISIWYGGFKPGMLCIFLSALSADYFFMGDYFNLAIRQPEDFFHLTVFIFVSFLMAWIAGDLHHSIFRSKQMNLERENYLIRHNEVLVELAKKGLSGSELDARLQEILESVVLTLGVEQSSLWFFNQDRSQLELHKQFDRYESIPIFHHSINVSDYPLYFEALEKSRVVRVEETQNDPRVKEFADQLLELNIHSLIDVPIRQHGKVIGVLCNVHVGERRVWIPEDQAFTSSVADLIALVVEEQERVKTESALKKSEARLRRLVDSEVIGVVFGDTQTRLISEANEAFLKMVGYNQEDVKNGRLHWPSMTPPEQLDAELQKWQECVQSKFCEPWEKEFIRKDGSRVPVLIGMTFLEDSGSEWACFVIDLSERRLQEKWQAMEYSVTQILTIDPTLSVAIPKILQTICEALSWEIGTFWERIPEANELRCTEMWTEKSAEYAEFIQATFNMSCSSGIGLPGKVWASGKARWVSDMERDFSFPRQKAAQERGVHTALAFPICLGDELLGVMEFFSERVQSPNTRLLTLLESVGSDIGQFLERKQAEEDLRLSQLHFNLALQAARMGYWSWDLKSNRMTWSDHLHFFHGGSDFGGTFEAFLKAVYIDDREWVQQTLLSAMSNKSDYNLEFRTQWPDGSIHWINARGQVFYDEDGEATRMIGLGIDMTERKSWEEVLRFAYEEMEGKVQKRTAELAKANQSLQAEIRERQKIEREALEIVQKEQRRFSAQLHDGICQNLTGIKMMSTAISQKLEKQNIAESQELKQVVELINQSITEARDMARGLFPVELESNSLMYSLSSLALRIEQAYKLTCHFICPKPILLEDNVTATHLYRIAQEAIHNTIQHGKANQIEISLRQKDQRLILSVRDNGGGMQGPKFSTGIGLQIMKYRARLLEAELDFETDSEGTLVTCRVPMSLGGRVLREEYTI